MIALFRPIFYVDINVTNRCNFNCKYCIQNHNIKDFDNNLTSDLFSFINKIFEFGQNMKKKQNIIGFWGGEPTLNFDLVSEVINRYKSRNDVSLFLYTNGSNLYKHIKFLKEISKYKTLFNDFPKILVQISYDGMCIQNTFRDRFNDVIRNIVIVDRNNIPFTLKATLPIQGFPYLYDMYVSYVKLTNIIKREINLKITIDYWNDKNLINDEDFEYYCKKLVENIIKIKDKFGNQKHFCNLFQHDKKFCSAGKEMVSIDFNGDVLPCHGFFELKEMFPEVVIGNIKNDLIFQKISILQQRLYNFKKVISNECKTCSSRFCMRCNAANFLFSDRKLFEEKFYDSCQNRLCLIYKLISKTIHGG